MNPIALPCRGADDGGDGIAIDSAASERAAECGVVTDADVEFSDREVMRADVGDSLAARISYTCL